jgi:hypothetical protein
MFLYLWGSDFTPYFSMLKIRAVKTTSGGTVLQVVLYEGRRVQIINPIGGAKASDEVVALAQQAQYLIAAHAQQASNVC